MTKKNIYHSLLGLTMAALLVPLSSFLISDATETFEAPTCTAPPAPTGIIAGYNGPPITNYTAAAVYFGGSEPSSVDGYEWTITGNAYIQSGQGTSNINYYYTCGEIEICVRAYSVNPFGVKCYSNWTCNTYDHLGEPCY